MALLRKSNQFSNDEVVRQLRTNIEYMQVDEKIQVINVTSTFKDEGKTLVITQLANMYAIKFPKVLLIDCDLRNPSVHKELGLSNAKGLTNLVSNLSNDTIIDNQPEVQHISMGDTGYDLAVITTGNKIPNPSEFLAYKKFQKFIKMAREQYNYILIDCPPVGLVSDGIPVSHLSDGTIYVVSCEENSKQKIRASFANLKRNGVRILGIVLNKIDLSNPKANSGYSYYGYGEDDKKKKGLFRGKK